MRFRYIDISVYILEAHQRPLEAARCFYMCGLMKCVFHPQLEEATASEKRACHEKSAMIGQPS